MASWLSATLLSTVQVIASARRETMSSPSRPIKHVNGLFFAFFGSSLYVVVGASFDVAMQVVTLVLSIVDGLLRPVQGLHAPLEVVMEDSYLLQAEGSMMRHLESLIVGATFRLEHRR